MHIEISDGKNIFRFFVTTAALIPARGSEIIRTFFLLSDIYGIHLFSASLTCRASVLLSLAVCSIHQYRQPDLCKL